MKRLSYILLSGLMLILSACDKDTESANFAPVVTTGSASNIYRMGATLSGSITLTETNTAQSYGILLSSFESMAEATEYPVKDASSNFSVQIQDLEPGTTYYYCAYASSGYSTAKSQIKSFTTTNSNAPVFNEVILQSKDEKSCAVSTELLDDGGSELLMTGFVWGEAGSGDPTIKSNVVNVEPQGSRLSATIKGMEPNKTYLVRAYGVNAQGVGYSNSISVTTNTATVPVLSDIIASDSTEVSITVKSTIVDAGLGEVTEYGFCYSSESKEPTTAHLVVENVEGNSKDFSALIEGLKPETTYYIRAYAINEKGTGYSETFEYTTIAPTEPGIYSLEDLGAFHDAIILGSDLSQWVNESGVINLYVDIEATLPNWTPIYQLSPDYVFDGNGHTITLKKTAVAEDDLGFAVFYNNMGTIQNLNVTMDMTLPSSGDGYTKPYATVCTLNNGVVKNCHSKVSADLKYYAACFGGIVYGNNSGATIIQCTSEGVINGGLILGGIAAQNGGGTISDCINSITIVDGGGDVIGGIAGYNYYSGQILNCVNKGHFSSPSNRTLFGVGGIVGRLFNGVVDNCQNNGNFEIPLANAVGGIAGNASEIMDIEPNNVTRIVKNCTNNGDIVGPDGVTGNMIGVLDGADSEMTGCIYGGGVNGAFGDETNAIGKDLRVKGDYSNGVVTLQEAGTLASLIPESDKYSITKLKVVGPLNGDDIRYLREMAGRDVNGNETDGCLVDLDISEATIVEGGGAYFMSEWDVYKTSNDLIGEYMFYRTILNRISIPNGAIIICSRAFETCFNLVSVNIPSGVLEIGQAAFAGCGELRNISIPETVTGIGNGAFSDCYNLSVVNIPSSVQYIPINLFSNCSSLTSVGLPYGITTIGSQAFYNCSALSEISIPNSVTTIEYEAFWDCTSLTSINLPDGITSIGTYAFQGCTSLSSVNIPNSMTTLENGLFRGCSSLANIAIPNSVTEIGTQVFQETALKSIVIPESITRINGHTFYKCSALTSVTLPASLTEIGSYAFSLCTSLPSITIPQNVVFIDTAAFDDCSALAEVTCKSTTPPGITDAWTFDGIASSATLYVPSGCVSAYKGTTWAKYFSIIKAEGETESNDANINDIPTEEW